MSSSEFLNGSAVRLPNAVSPALPNTAPNTVSCIPAGFEASHQVRSSVSRVLAAALSRHCNHAFGLVGNANAHFTSALVEFGVDYASVRHESGAVTAADAFHRAGGGLAIATATCGAGFTNTISALAEARAARVPLIFVVGTHPKRPRPFDLAQESLLESLDIQHLTITPESVLACADFAVQQATRIRQPIALLLPYDVQNAPAELSGPSVLVDSTEASSDAVSEAEYRGDAATQPTDMKLLKGVSKSLATTLCNAQRPLIVAGRGVVLSNQAELVRTIGDSIGALFMETAMARRALSSPWVIGTVGGFADKQQVELARQADVVLFLGASFNTFQNRGGGMLSPTATIIQVIDEPHPAAQAVTTQILAKLEHLLPELAVSLRLCQRRATDDSSARRANASSSSWRDTVTTVPTVKRVEELTCTDGRLDPRACLSYLDRIVPKRRAVCTDGGHFLGWVPKYMSVPGPKQQVLVGTAIQSIGMGMGSLVGLAAARPEDYCILVTGDGGATMALADLPAAIEQLQRGRGGCIAVINDAAYGAELHQFGAAGLNTATMEIADYDFAAVGRAFGAKGFSIRTAEDLAQLDAFFRDEVERYERGSARGNLNAMPSGSAEALPPAPVAVIDFKVSRGVVADFIKEVLAKEPS